jgi:CDP-2,3-bis-(O-geranylgeranyl)-sn-glycerol synthase
VVVDIILSALWRMMPAYVANPSAVLFGGGTPMDFGKTMSDGKRVFGDGKTWRGFIGGIFAGVFLGLILQSIAFFLDSDTFMFDRSYITAFFIIFLLAFGSMTGDLVGSFVKRRMGIERGAKKPLLDMYGFLLFAFIFVLIFRWDWTIAHYFYNEYIIGFITVLVATPLLHRGVNLIGHRMGKKDVPW